MLWVGMSARIPPRSILTFDRSKNRQTIFLDNVKKFRPFPLSSNFHNSPVAGCQSTAGKHENISRFKLKQSGEKVFVECPTMC